MNDNNNLLTIERAIADNLDPASLRMVADSNDRKGPRRAKQAQNLRRVADRLKLTEAGRNARDKERGE